MFKKAMIIIVSLLFITSAYSTTIGKNIKTHEEQNKITIVETITLYRHGIDGSITPVEVIIELEDNQDLNQAIMQKCEELFGKDPEMQNSLVELNNEKARSDLTSKWGWVFIMSHGKGTHLKTKILITFFIKLYLFKLRFPKISLKAKREIFCKYEKDPNAKTTMIPIARYLMGYGGKENVTGNHSVYVHQFSGFTTWSGRFSISPEDKLHRAFFGFARFALAKKLL